MRRGIARRRDARRGEARATRGKVGPRVRRGEATRMAGSIYEVGVCHGTGALHVVEEKAIGGHGGGAAHMAGAHVARLLWGGEDPLALLGLDAPPDVLLAADVVYASSSQDLTAGLVATLRALSGPETLVLFSNVRRFPDGHPQGEGKFFEALGASFDSAALPQHQVHPDFQRSGVGSCAVRVLWRKDGGDGPPLVRSARKAARRATLAAEEVVALVAWGSAFRGCMARILEWSIGFGLVLEVCRDALLEPALPGPRPSTPRHDM